MKTKNNTVCVTEIQRFCMHDGPGLRTTVFFKGCPLHCRWCHNPETQKSGHDILFSRTKCIVCGACAAVCPAGAQILDPERAFDREKCLSCGACTAACPTQALTAVGMEMTVDRILEIVRKDSDFYGADGGLTVSGGEPLFQSEGAVSLFQAAKDANISTCVETCGVFNPQLIPELIQCVDLFLYDIKDTDERRLFENTGAALAEVVSNLKKIDESGKETVMRCILIPDVNLNDTHAQNLAELFYSLKHARYVELLPYHPFGISKAEQLGISHGAEYRRPTEKETADFAARLKQSGVPVKCRGSIFSS